MLKALFAVALVACSSTSPSSTPPPPGPGPVPTPNAEPAHAQPEEKLPPAPPPATRPGIGEKCGEGDECQAPATCVKYYGIAGKRGPEFKTCEVKCDPTSKCPDGKTCRTIADGPGSVCR